MKLQQEIDTLSFAVKAANFERAKLSFEDELDKMLHFNYVNYSCDEYDNSIAFIGASNEAILNEEICLFLYNNGFSVCYLYHEDNWETHYSNLPSTDKWLVSYNHRNGGKGLLVEEIPESWGDGHGAIITRRLIANAIKEEGESMNKDRKAFEKILSTDESEFDGIINKDKNDKYVEWYTQLAYKYWQAALDYARKEQREILEQCERTLQFYAVDCTSIEDSGKPFCKTSFKNMGNRAKQTLAALHDAEINATGIGGENET
ncbi:MAG: hypothetical protein CV087_22680 [Candidatus Brocadia sp. WS118]|nr:MAG: hypothetical protein CV087_22680 [Candidatus Brocadia sp. WS118]